MHQDHGTPVEDESTVPQGREAPRAVAGWVQLHLLDETGILEAGRAL